MKFSYNWLKQLTGLAATPQELADELSLKSVEIEGVEEVGGDFMKTVVVGEVISCEKHPDADRLKVCQVDIGTDLPRQTLSGNSPTTFVGGGALQIVCGASNVRAGIKVPVALPNTKLPGGEIKISKLRGVESQGMICAEDELGLGSGHDGIMILDESLVVGTPLSDIYHDFVLDGAILPNRGDLGSHVGLAREISAIWIGNQELRIKNQGKVATGEQHTGNRNQEAGQQLTIAIEDESICPLYQACLVENIIVHPSPTWMQARLVACGIRPINNIVDITNFVMLEVGNPLHVYDAMKLPGYPISGGTRASENNLTEDDKISIHIRYSNSSESITTLDGERRELPAGILVIANEEMPIAVAGVIGGKDSSVTAKTTEIILEVANFDSATIRHGARTLGLNTESSARFAKGLSPYLATIAMERARELVVQICPEAQLKSVVQSGKIAESQKEMRVNPEQIKKFIAQDIALPAMKAILESLGFIVSEEGSTWFVKIPPYRSDVSIWQDIAEEVARIYGLDKVPEVLPNIQISPDKPKMLYVEQATKKYFAGRGFCEVFTYSLLKPEVQTIFTSQNTYFAVSNPLPEGNAVLRSSLIPGVVQVAAENLKRDKIVAHFDVSRVYLPANDPEMVDSEPRRLALVYSAEGDGGWATIRHTLDMWAKDHGITLEYKDLGLGEYAHPGRSAQVLYNSQPVGETYELHPSVLQFFDIKQRVWAAEIDLSYLALFLQNIPNEFSTLYDNIIYKEFSRFEVVRRDLAILIDEGVDPREVANAISSATPAVIGVEQFDDYRGEGIEKGKKSLGYRVTLQATDHTLTEAEIKSAVDQILANLKKQYSIEVR